MKKLLLIALIAFGAPANADNQETCNRLVQDLFYYALGGAPFEVLEMRFNLDRDEMSDPDTLMMLVFDQIFLKIGEDRLIGREPNLVTLEYAKGGVCSDTFVKGFFK